MKKLARGWQLVFVLGMEGVWIVHATAHDIIEHMS